MTMCVSRCAASDHHLVRSSATCRPAMDERRRMDPTGSYAQLGGGHDFPGPSLPTCRDSLDGENRDLDARIAATGELVEVEGGDGVCAQRRKFIVPKGHFFAMGDNRDNSVDGRYWGFVPHDHLVGKAVITFLSFRPDNFLPRLTRFFRPIR